MAVWRVAMNFRIEEDLYEKVKIIAPKEKRSINGQMEYFISKGIEAYEKEHEEIPVAKDA